MGEIRDELETRYPEVIHRLGNLTVNLYEMSDAVAGKQALVVLESTRRTPTGTVEKRKLACDLDRLEAVVGRGRILKSELDQGIGRSPDGLDSKTPLSTLEVGTITARFFERPGTGGEGRLVVQLNQEIEGPKGEKLTQKFACDLERLSKAASYGVNFEEERGFQKQWNLIVSVNSLTETEGMVSVKCMHWEKDDVLAQRFADKSSGFGLVNEKYRRPFKGDNLSLLVDVEKIPSLGADVRYLIEERKRVGPDMLLGIWYERGVRPTPGYSVKYIGGRDEASREPTPYRIVPSAVHKPQGANDDPIYVIITVDRNENPPIHSIKEVHMDEKVAERRFLELRGEATRKLERTVEPVKQAEQPIDLSEHTLPKGPFRPR